MPHQAVSVNIKVDVTGVGLDDEDLFRQRCFDRLQEIMAGGIESFADQATLEGFDEFDDEEDELAQDFLKNKEYGL